MILISIYLINRLSEKNPFNFTQFSLYQCIDDPTHYTEHSSSVIDLLFVSNKGPLIHSGIADAFLNQDLRYHCPIYGIFKFSKPKVSSFTRRIWYYDRCDFNVLRNKGNAVDWDSLQDINIDTFANNIHSTVMSLATECIPNKLARVRPTEPVWINSKIKIYIRKRKRAYKRAKRTNIANDWIKFKTLHNKTISEIRISKKSFYDNMAAKLSSPTLSPKDWWTTLKSFISPNSSTSIPLLSLNGIIYTDETDKANILNDFFQSQTVLNEENAVLSDLPPSASIIPLESIVFTADEVESVLRLLPTGKASGPDSLSKHLLRELSNELAKPYQCLF